jgi:hypothetical protein
MGEEEIGPAARAIARILDVMRGYARGKHLRVVGPTNVQVELLAVCRWLYALLEACGFQG